MTRKLILYTYFLFGCVAYGRLQAQTEARGEFMFENYPKNPNSSGRDSSEKNSEFISGRLKSEDYVFTKEYNQYTELKAVVENSQARLDSMIYEIDRKESRLSGLHESGILTEKEISEKKSLLKTARLKCRELKIHLDEAEVLLAELKEKFQDY